MKNYKAKMTAQNMEITDDQKPSLARLIIFATALGDNFDELEATRTLKIADKWKSETTPGIHNVDDFRKLQQEKWTEEQDLSDIIAIMVDILSDSDFFDIQKALTQTLKQYSNDLVSINPLTTSEEIKAIRFSNTDFARQFYGDDGKGGFRRISDSEKYANLMYLSNQLSHAFEENLYREPSGINRTEIKHVVQELRKIKNWCIHQLIAQKTAGARIDIASSIDNNIKSANNGIISFSIPNYFEPFIVHYNPSMLSENEKKECNGRERFISSGIRTTFPQYLSKEKMVLLEKVYSEKYWYGGNIQNIRGQRLQWLFETRDILNTMYKAKIKNTPSKEDMHLKAKEGNSKAIDFQRENIETLNTLESTLGITLPEYFKEGFVRRTSYSISKYMSDVEETVKSQLLQRGVPVENVDKEFARFIMYVKMVQPLSSIVQKSKTEKNATAAEGLEEYSDVYNFIMDNIDDETDYSTLKSKTKKHKNSTNLSKNVDLEIIEQAEVQTSEENLVSKEAKKEETQLPINLPPEKVEEIIAEIENLNRDCSSLSAIVKGLSTKLQSTQAKIDDLKQSLHGVLGNSEPTEDKGDIG